MKSTFLIYLAFVHLARRIRLVDEGILIEEIMRPYPTAHLRARRQREAMERFAENQAAQWRREDAAKCNILQPEIDLIPLLT